MEGKGMKVAVVMGVLLLLFLTEQATASFADCYGACYATCILDMKKLFPIVPKKLLPCAFKCIKKCFASATSSPTIIYYCNLGCSLDSCTDDVDDAGKVGSCVDNCSNNLCRAKA